MPEPEDATPWEDLPEEGGDVPLDDDDLFGDEPPLEPTEPSEPTEDDDLFGDDDDLFGDD